MKKLSLRIVCMVLSLALCLSLAGCAPADQRAYERACELLEAGEYEAAIEAFSAIGLYEEISEKIDEAQELLVEENTEFLYGEWVNIHTGAVFTFSKGGKGSISADGQNTAFSYTCDGKTVEITIPIPLQLKTDKEDGVLHLKDQDGHYDLVSQKDFEKMRPVTVEITPDNWQDYFEGRPAQDVGVDANGNVNHRETGFGIFLKEEYLSRLDYNSCDGAVRFEVEHGFAPYLVEGDLQSDDYRLKESQIPVDYDIYSGTVSAVFPVNYRGWQDWRSEESDFNGAVCSFIADQPIYIQEFTYLMAVDNVKVLDAWGTLTLNP